MNIMFLTEHLYEYHVSYRAFTVIILQIQTIGFYDAHI